MNINSLNNVQNFSALKNNKTDNTTANTNFKAQETVECPLQTVNAQMALANYTIPQFNMSFKGNIPNEEVSDEEFEKLKQELDEEIKKLPNKSMRLSGMSYFANKSNTNIIKKIFDKDNDLLTNERFIKLAYELLLYSMIPGQQKIADEILNKSDDILKNKEFENFVRHLLAYVETPEQQKAALKLIKSINPINSNNNSNRTIKGTNIEAITSDEEYNQILSELKEHSSWFWHNGEADKYDEGLLPYSGSDDISCDINNYLYSGVYDEIPEEYLIDYIRVLDYSLKKLDETYGSYEGVVYRYGNVNSENKNYLSTASHPVGACRHSGINEGDLIEEPFNIILGVKHGHKIVSMQKKLGTAHIYENEILLDSGSKLELIGNYADLKKEQKLIPEIEKSKQNLIKNMPKWAESQIETGSLPLLIWKVQAD